MPLAPLNEPYASDPTLLLALCIWREARGESHDAKVGVASVVMNRCVMAPAQGFKRSVTGNILHPWAFSSFMEGDPNAVKYPASGDSSWTDSQLVAQNEMRNLSTDPTDGAIFYHSNAEALPPPKDWGNVTFTGTIDHLHFFKIA